MEKGSGQSQNTDSGANQNTCTEILSKTPKSHGNRRWKRPRSGTSRDGARSGTQESIIVYKKAKEQPTLDCGQASASEELYLNVLNTREEVPVVAAIDLVRDGRGGWIRHGRCPELEARTESCSRECLSSDL